MEEMLSEKASASEAVRCSPTFTSRFLHYYSLFVSGMCNGGALGGAPASAQLCPDQHVQLDPQGGLQLHLSSQNPAAGIVPGPLPAALTPELLLLQHLLLSQPHAPDGGLCAPLWPDQQLLSPQLSPTQLASPGQLCTPASVLARLLAEHSAAAVASAPLAPGLMPLGAPFTPQFPLPGALALACSPPADATVYSQALAALAASTEPTANAASQQPTGTPASLFTPCRVVNSNWRIRC